MWEFSSIYSVTCYKSVTMKFSYELFRKDITSISLKSVNYIYFVYC